MLHRYKRATSEDIAEAINARKTPNSETVLRDDVCGRHLSMLQLPHWSSGLHMVAKKDGTARPVRRLSSASTSALPADAYPILHIHDFTAGLSECKIFLKMDLIKELPPDPCIRAQDVPKTAIATPFGLFEFTRMPFGLKNAWPKRSQCLMDNITWSSWLGCLFILMTNAGGVSYQPVHHERDLRLTLQRTLGRFGLVLNVDKCVSSACANFNFLATTISKRKASVCCTDKVKAVLRFKRPRTVKALQRFLGLVNFLPPCFLPNIASNNASAYRRTCRRASTAYSGTTSMMSAFAQTKQRLATSYSPLPPDLQTPNSASTQTRAPRPSQERNPPGCRMAVFSPSVSSVDAQLPPNHATRHTTWNSWRFIPPSSNFDHMLEGRRFWIFTDQKPLTGAFFKAQDPVSNQQRHQLAFISEFATDIAHLPVLENVIADTLTWQFDDKEASATVHAVTHTLKDIDLSDLARHQRHINEEPASSLRLENVRFQGIDHAIVCDTSLQRPRVLVPESWRRKIFDAIHGLDDQSERRPWPSSPRLTRGKTCAAMSSARLRSAEPVPLARLQFTRTRPSLWYPYLPSVSSKFTLTSWGHSPPEQGYKYSINDDRQDHPLARGHTNHGHDGGNSYTSFPGDLDLALRNPLHRYHWQRRTVHFTFAAWETALSCLGINVSATTAYHPQSNSIVERLHRTMKNALRCAVRSSKSWTRSLPWVMLGIRNTHWRLTRPPWLRKWFSGSLSEFPVCTSRVSNCRNDRLQNN